VGGSAVTDADGDVLVDGASKPASRPRAAARLPPRAARVSAWRSREPGRRSRPATHLGPVTSARGGVISPESRCAAGRRGGVRGLGLGQRLVVGWPAWRTRSSPQRVCGLRSDAHRQRCARQRTMVQTRWQTLAHRWLGCDGATQAPGCGPVPAGGCDARRRGEVSASLPSMRRRFTPPCSTLWGPESRSDTLSCEFVGEAIGPR
jgi:hypothetical protein